MQNMCVNWVIIDRFRELLHEVKTLLRQHIQPAMVCYVQDYDYTWKHYNDVIMGAMAYLITSLTIICSAVYSGADQRKHESSASLAFVRGIHRWPVNSPHKGQVTRKIVPFDDVIMARSRYILVDYSSTQWALHIPNNLVRLLWFRIGLIVPSTCRAIRIALSLWNELYQSSESKDACIIKKSNISWCLLICLHHISQVPQNLTHNRTSIIYMYIYVYMCIYIYIYIYWHFYLSIVVTMLVADALVITWDQGSSCHNGN